jgi:hypothetical protein
MLIVYLIFVRECFSKRSFCSLSLLLLEREKRHKFNNIVFLLHINFKLWFLTMSNLTIGLNFTNDENFTNDVNFTNNSAFHRDFFLQLFTFRPSLIILITFYLLSTPFLVLTLYSMIWFDHFGSDAKRTIVNRLTSSLCCSAIAAAICPQTIDLMRIFVGKFNEDLAKFLQAPFLHISIQLLSPTQK